MVNILVKRPEICADGRSIRIRALYSTELEEIDDAFCRAQISSVRHHISFDTYIYRVYYVDNRNEAMRFKLCYTGKLSILIEE